MPKASHCSTHKGMWREGMSVQHKCVLVTVAHILGFRPGQLVLDWGSGCGHKLGWAKMLFDVEGMGLELQPAAVAWARRHGPGGHFCAVDGRDLRWIPDETFDHVISFAAIYHLNAADQCHVGLQLAAKLRVGGRAYLGWNSGLAAMTNWDWLACFSAAAHNVPLEADMVAEGRNLDPLPGLPGALAALAAGVRVEAEAVEDGFIFPRDTRAVTGNGSFLYQFPAYSVFFTRVA